MDGVTEEQVLEELMDLEPNRWFQVLDLIGYLKERGSRESVGTGASELTARNLLESELVGLWADRDDIGDNLAYARKLRREAENRRRRPQ